MIVAFDNTFLTLALNPAATPRPNPATGKPIPHCRQRIEALIDGLGKKGDTLIIPAPCLAEVMVAAPDIDKVIAVLRNYTAVDIGAFDSKAAIEWALMTRDAFARGDKKAGEELEWHRVKFDRQIVAIAKAHGASTLYTDDMPQSNFAALGQLPVVHTWELDLPDDYRQEAFDYEA